MISIKVKNKNLSDLKKQYYYKQKVNHPENAALFQENSCFLLLQQIPLAIYRYS